MIHPVVIAIGLADATAVLLFIFAALRAEPVVRNWAPASATARQLTLERNVEAVSLLGRLGAVAFAVGALTLLVALTQILPLVVPGAMCGTGIVDAAEATWPLILRGATLMLLWGWATLDRLDRTAPRAPMAPWTAGTLLPVAPLSIYTAAQTAMALGRLDGQVPVDCCAAMYAEAAAASGDAAEAIPTPHLDVVLLIFGALVLVGSGWAVFRRSRRDDAAVGLMPSIALLILAVGWTWLAGEVLIERWAAYHYEVLQHRCPWCLFLPDHGGVGYAIFGALAVVVLESVAGVSATVAMRSGLRQAGRARLRTAVTAIGLAVVVFIAVCGGPAIGWWIRFGVWL